MESEYLKKYASKVLEIKGNSLHRDKEIARLSTILNNTFTNVYKAVAFDVDGTLTRDGSTEIDKEMAKLLGKLLIKSVPVLLISGRGRGSMKVAVKEIIDKSKLSMGYFKRLSCIAHNGVYWLKSSSLSKSNILNEEIVLVDVEDIKKFHSIEREIKNSTFRIYFENSEMSISKEPLKECYLLRITIKNELIQGGSFSLAEFRKYLKKIVEVNAVSLTEATYGENYLFNISNTDKITALEYYAKTLGIRLKSILRIGDQGQAGGNDFDLFQLLINH